jgi:hypothetical protein
LKGQIVNIFGFSGHPVSVPTTQLYHWSVKETTDYSKPRAWLCSNKTLFTKQEQTQTCPAGFSLLVPTLVFLGFAI